MQILQRESNEEHPLGTADIIRRLEELSIKCERKSLYDDIECLREYGVDVEYRGGKGGGYFVAERDFELPELKLLVDAVQSSKFITEKKSAKLIKKLGAMTDIYTERQLDREVFVANRVKTMNESIYFNVDAIQSAISANRKIVFKYFDLGRDGKRIFRHDGKYYTVSPWSLVWDDENYYLVAVDDDTKSRRHYRVDKMMSISSADDERDGKDIMKDFDPAVYSRQMFGMFNSECDIVTLRCENSLAGVMFDRFGSDLVMRCTDDEHFEIDVRVSVSPVFFGWVFGFGGAVTICAPSYAIEKYAAMVNSQAEVLNRR